MRIFFLADQTNWAVRDQKSRLLLRISFFRFDSSRKWWMGCKSSRSYSPLMVGQVTLSYGFSLTTAHFIRENFPSILLLNNRNSRNFLSSSSTCRRMPTHTIRLTKFSVKTKLRFNNSYNFQSPGNTEYESDPLFRSNEHGSEYSFIFRYYSSIFCRTTPLGTFQAAQI